MTGNSTSDYSFLSQLDLDDDVIYRLSSFLGKTETGDETVIVSPIAQYVQPGQLLEDWSKVFKGGMDSINDDLLQLEEANRSKFGPRSLAQPWLDRVSSVKAYFSDEYTIDSGLEEKLSVGTQGLRACLRPLNLSGAMKFIKNDTNSGLPYFVRKSKVKSIYSEKFQELLDRRDPCVMFTRTTEIGKLARVLWGFSMADTINEMMFYRPLFEYQSKLPWRSALRGPTEVDRHLSDIVFNAISQKEKLVSIDFSKYDTTVKSRLQKASFDYISALFQSNSSVKLSYIAERFRSIGLVTPGGIYTGDHGVPSGSTFTNEVDSIAQFLIASSLGFDSNQFDIQGDDGAYRTHKPEILKEGFRAFGLEVNDEKTYIRSNSLVYLQNLYSSDYARGENIGGIYPTYRALNRIIYPERFTSFKDSGLSGQDWFSIRTVSILENCKHHPLFEKFVRFIWSVDKYNLKFTEKGLHRYIEHINKSKGSVGIVQNQYGENLRGIKDFETVKLINTF